ncbi:MAG: SGNH/GDSL hydrolase family protein [Nitrospirae bacterium]|nr:SGNH/GDSL hydrolase family protein [Nitrospirota bacterium]MBF0540031.1 SGNH/GDSL hydrolase family protein [Nitrospirota bacterium]
MDIKNNKIKNTIFTLIILTIIFIVFLVVGEIAARKVYGDGMFSIIDPQVHHCYRPYVDLQRAWGSGRRFHFMTNSLGWRDKVPNRLVEKENKTQKRIVFLGDSMTEGMGYEQEKTQSGVVESLLLKEGLDVEVLNGGTASFSPLLEYTRLRQFLNNGYKTDIVVVLPDFADFNDEVQYRSFFKFDETGEPIKLNHFMYSPVVRFFLNNSALARIVKRDGYNKFKDWYKEYFAKDNIKKSSELRMQETKGLPVSKPKDQLAIVKVKDVLAASPTQNTYVRLNYWKDQPSLNGWIKEITPFMLSNMDRIKALCDKNGIELIVVIYPWPCHFTAPANEPGIDTYENTFVSYCKDRNIKYIDLIPVFKNSYSNYGPTWQDLFIIGDMHFNENGHKLAGTTIANELIPEVKKIKR